ncbi:response regulator transcription factor [Rapidithrix thailandica]|uniref:Response regulator transcription factor n=1 Tax=Rapidithrix thailandica TaxID=413964 RepID=A0AAW9SEL5_9BACT
MSISSEKIRIIVADDHSMFLDGLISLLNDVEYIEIVGKASNGKEALHLLKKVKADWVITDISMPEMDGIVLTGQIKKKYPEIKVLVVSMYHQSETIAKVVQQEADGYLLKNAGKEELLKAIASIQAGEKYFSEEIKQKYLESMFAPKKKSREQVPLSRREKEVLVLIAQENTTPEIAEKLFISQHTVESHRKNIIRKLNVRNTAGIVKYAIQQGLLDT